MKLPHTLAIALSVVSCLWLMSCSQGPCPQGQELRENRWQGQVKERGCVSKDAQGSYRRNGRWVFFYASGKKEAEGEYRNALEGGETGSSGILVDGREGRWVFWYENGQKKSEMTFRAGKGEGLRVEWYESGQRFRESSYHDGILEGLAVEWYENGQKHRELPFQAGKLEGAAVEWYENGQRQRESVYRNGISVPGTLKEWDPKGNPK
jgi:antitoxin component YwqK of YwqJK toxin-antitoxin module